MFQDCKSAPPPLSLSSPPWNHSNRHAFEPWGVAASRLQPHRHARPNHRLISAAFCLGQPHSSNRASRDQVCLLNQRLCFGPGCGTCQSLSLCRRCLALGASVLTALKLRLQIKFLPDLEDCKPPAMWFLHSLTNSFKSCLVASSRLLDEFYPHPVACFKPSACLSFISL